MYRQYEDPRKLENWLEAVEQRIEEEKHSDNPDDDRLIDLYLEQEELKDRIRFAWDDIEYDENCARYGY